MVIDIFVLADSKEEAAAVARRNVPGLRFERTYAIDANDRDRLSAWADGWSTAFPGRRVDVVGSLGRYGYRVNGELR